MKLLHLSRFLHLWHVLLYHWLPSSCTTFLSCSFSFLQHFPTEPVLPILPTLLLSSTFYLPFLPLFQSYSSWWSTICTGNNRERRMSAPRRAACQTAPVPTRFPPGRSSHMTTKPPWRLSRSCAAKWRVCDGDGPCQSEYTGNTHKEHLWDLWSQMAWRVTDQWWGQNLSVSTQPWRRCRGARRCLGEPISI